LLRRLLIALGVILAAVALCRRAEAGVVVLSNQTPEKVGATIIEPDGRRTQYDLDPKGVAAVPAEAAVAAVFDVGGKPRSRQPSILPAIPVPGSGGTEFHPPSLGRSQCRFRPLGDGCRFGFGARRDGGHGCGVIGSTLGDSRRIGSAINT